MHGRSLALLIRNAQTAWREVFIYECLEGYGGTRPMLGAMTVDWSLIQTWATRTDVATAAAPFSELYHRGSDRAEARNVATLPANAAIRARLEREIARHIEKIRPVAVVGR